VLGNELGLPDCNYESPEDIRAEITGIVGNPRADNTYRGDFVAKLDAVKVDAAQLDIGIYRVDPIVRRSVPLQQTARGQLSAPTVAPRLKSA
jgi:hypothetical protein